MRSRYKILVVFLMIMILLKWQFRVKEGSSFIDMVDNFETTMIALGQDEKTKDLLERYMPTIYVDRSSYKPIDFYETYLPQTRLRKSGFMDSTLESKTSEKTFKSSVGSNLYYLDYKVSYKDELKREVSTAPVYGRVYESQLKDKKLTFLKYSYVFPYSGLPENIEWYKKIGSYILGNPYAWHELDIHGAVHVVLYEEEPIAIVLAQHNSHKTYIVSDDAIEITFSKFSNEPYLRGDGHERYERAVGNPLDYDFLLGLTDKVPLTGGYDQISSEEDTVRVETHLIQLPLDDPLYTAHMSLGDRKKILGLFNTFYMDGPPGINYYTLPDLLDLSDLMAFNYFDINDEFLKIYNKMELSFSHFDIEDMLSYQIDHIYHVLFD